MVTNVCHHNGLVLLLALLFVNQLPVTGYQMMQSSDKNDKTIQSEGFPGAYPPECNISWHWRTDEGYWAVVFFTFVLDTDTLHDHNHDWLQIDDGDRRLRYSNSTPPPTNYITEGSDLIIRFVSDKKTDSRSLGFRIKILYAKTTNDLRLRIHDVRKAEQEKQKGENDKKAKTTLLIVVVSSACVLIICLIIVVLCYMYRQRKHNSKMIVTQSTIVRNNSGVSFARHDSVRENRQTEENSPSLSRQTSRSYSTGRAPDVTSLDGTLNRSQRPSVQRSNSNTSQMNWVLRAELLKSNDRKTKPNLYTSPKATSSRTSNSGNNHSEEENEEGVDVPYVDVMEVITTNIQQMTQSNDYDNFDSVFNKPMDHENQGFPLCKRCSLEDIIYENTTGVENDNNNNDDNEKVIGNGGNTNERKKSSSKRVLQRGLAVEKNDDKTDNSQDEKSNNLQVNVHDPKSHMGQEHLTTLSGSNHQEDNPVYDNVSIDQQVSNGRTLVSVRSDSLSEKESKWSRNEIVPCVANSPGNNSIYSIPPSRPLVADDDLSDIYSTPKSDKESVENNNYPYNLEMVPPVKHMNNECENGSDNNVYHVPISNKACMVPPANHMNNECENENENDVYHVPISNKAYYKKCSIDNVVPAVSHKNSRSDSTSLYDHPRSSTWK